MILTLSVVVRHLKNDFRAAERASGRRYTFDHPHDVGPTAIEAQVCLQRGLENSSQCCLLVFPSAEIGAHAAAKNHVELLWSTRIVRCPRVR